MPESPRPAAAGVTPERSGREEFRREVIRKSIHFSSIAIPIFYFFTPRPTALAVAVAMTSAALALDVGRHYLRPVARLFDALFGPLLRRHETDARAKRLNGGTWVLIAATIMIWLFPKLIAITAFLILIISDLAAALVGRKLGRTRFLRKTLEGSAAFLGTALAVVAATPKIAYLPEEYALGAAAAIGATIVEASGLPLDDNLSVPLAVGLLLWTGYVLALPSLDLYRFG